MGLRMRMYNHGFNTFSILGISIPSLGLSSPSMLVGSFRGVLQDEKQGLARRIHYSTLAQYRNRMVFGHTELKIE
jgi:hypothetical protein